VSRLGDDQPDYTPCPIPHANDPDRPRRPAPGALLCTGHVEQGRSILHELPKLDDQLAVIAAPTGSQRPSGGRSADSPIPYHEKAALHRKALRNSLTAWCRHILAERSLIWTGDDTITDMCAFLARHHDWSVTQPWADQYALDLRGISYRARGLLSKRPPGEATRVPCPAPEGCHGMLTAPFRDAELLDRTSIDSVKLTCRECGWEVRVDEWLDLAIAAGYEQVLAPDVAVVVLANSLGAQVNSAATVRSWAHRGRIARHERDGQTLYDLLEVRRWLATRRDGQAA
jgi:hypothetical protein